MDKAKMMAMLQKAYQNVKPWLLYVAIFLVLKYTGLISAASFVTQSALLKTGLLDAKATESPEVARTFDYNFEVKDLNGQAVDIKAFKGKTLFINLWATWCGPCRVEMPSIQSLYDTVDKDKVVFVMLSLDHKDPYNKVTAFIKEKGYTFPVYLPNSDLPDLLQVKTIPTTYIVDPKGKIVLKETGVTNFDTDKFRKFLQSFE